MRRPPWCWMCWGNCGLIMYWPMEVTGWPPGPETNILDKLNKSKLG